MTVQILFCWLGTTDVKTSKGPGDVNLGPVAQVAEACMYQEVVLLNNWQKTPVKNYVAWLQKKTSSQVSIQQVQLSEPTNFGEIYQAALKIVAEKLQDYRPKTTLVFHLSPGTPAMAAVGILRTKTLYTAKIVESSKDHSAQKVSVPSEIATNFIPVRPIGRYHQYPAPTMTSADSFPAGTGCTKTSCAGVRGNRRSYRQRRLRTH